NLVLIRGPTGLLTYFDVIQNASDNGSDVKIITDYKRDIVNDKIKSATHHRSLKYHRRRSVAVIIGAALSYTLTRCTSTIAHGNMNPCANVIAIRHHTLVCP
ncbi:hypothetical protein BGZ58_000393, partial [Dissophora ornata]